MDLEAVLRRHPKVALVDELAHTNIPGSGHNTKRWEDVMELLGAGIDVITTVNIQHLESIADAVEQISGVPIKERVPDWVLRKADQIELVDSSPEQLRRRMLHGNIYPPEKVPQALTHFFREDNLMALRELPSAFWPTRPKRSCSSTSKHTTPESYGRQVSASSSGSPRHRVPTPLSEELRRMASRIKAELHILHIIPGEGTGRKDEEQLGKLRQLATDVGAHWNEIQAEDPAQALFEFAQAHQITQIVVGSSARSRWQELKSGGSHSQEDLGTGGTRWNRCAHHREARPELAKSLRGGLLALPRGDARLCECPTHSPYRVVQWTTGNVGEEFGQGDRGEPRARARRLLRLVTGEGGSRCR